MGRVINIANKLDREPRFLILDDTHKFKINCSKNTVMKVMALEPGSGDDLGYMDEALTLLVGKEAVKQIEDMDLPFDNWMTIFKAAIAVATNKNFEEVESDFRGEEE